MKSVPAQPATIVPTVQAGPAHPFLSASGRAWRTLKRDRYALVGGIGVVCIVLRGHLARSEGVLLTRPPMVFGFRWIHHDEVGPVSIGQLQ